MTSILRAQTRQIKVEVNINPYAAGSVLIAYGNTNVHITATIDDNVPPWLKGQGRGWVTAEYGMLPGATHSRNKREVGKISGRSQEIQRLIGRSLRTMVDLKALGERVITVDCDVIVADGGTRTASITGGAIALELAIKNLLQTELLSKNPIKNRVAAISVGLNDQQQVLADLNYDEDSSCSTDMNIVMTRDGRFVEIQGTAESEPFHQQSLDNIIHTAKSALSSIFAIQDNILGPL